MEEISSATNSVSSMDSESVKKYLFKMAMKSRWEEVVQAYTQNKWAHKARITRLGDTALHIAVSDCQEKYVEELVKPVSKEDLKIQNERRNTPLHLAAAMGNVRMCECIAKKDPSLVGIPNKDKETPIFLAALQGKKDAFLCLHYICAPVESYPTRYSYCRREDGETILHCAISGEYFDLAFQIIALYKDLVNWMNEDGFTPLHLLASMPSAFKSGSLLRRWNIIIYHCIYVDELKVEQADHFHKRVTNTIKKERDPKYPENYKTCINIMRVFRDMFDRHEKQESTDAENPNEPKVEYFMRNRYNTCFDFVKILSKAMLIVFGLGSKGIKKIRDKKEKHKWAVQIMDELIKSAVMYEYEDSGMSPYKDDETMPYQISDGGHGITLTTGSLEEPSMTHRPSNTDYQQNDNNQNNRKNGEGSSQPEVKEEQTPEMEKKETLILIVAKKMVELFPEVIEKKTPEMAKKETPILIAAKKILELFPEVKEKKTSGMANMETPILIAAKNGVTEMVEQILDLYPVAIHDLNAGKKNIVLLAVENRQPDVYQLLLERVIMKESAFFHVDRDGNSALHLAAKFGYHRPRRIPGAALQMQWEIKWYEFVKKSMPPHFFVRHNKNNETARDIFAATHAGIVKEGGKWLTTTSQNCSVVSALIATVTFATSSTVPGGTNEKNGKPTLENEPAFDVFAIASLAALCFSITSMVIFVAITSRYQEKDFGKNLARKLLVGLTSLFLSIAAMLISFCAGHFFVLRDRLKYAALPFYAITCLPVTFFAMAQFPWYVDLALSTFKKVPQRSYKE